MQKYKILIADYDDDFRPVLEENLSTLDFLEIVDIVNSGEQLIKSALKYDVDIILTEYLLQGVDGIIAIKKFLEAKASHKETMIYMLTAFASKEVTREAMSAGISHLMIKPVSIDYLIERIFEYAKSNNETKIDIPILTIEERLKIMRLPMCDQILFFLSKLHFRSGMKGFEYIAAAAELLIRDRATFSMITKVLYPEISKKFSTTPASVERAIRNAIQCAWDSNSRELHNMFPENLMSNERPSNSQFLSTFSDRIRIEMKVSEIL